MWKTYTKFVSNFVFFTFYPHSPHLPTFMQAQRRRHRNKIHYMLNAIIIGNCVDGRGFAEGAGAGIKTDERLLLPMCKSFWNGDFGRKFKTFNV